jgi:hypothetical protein
MLGVPQSRSGQVWKISPLPVFDPWTVYPVASRYTDWALSAPGSALFEMDIFLIFKDSADSWYIHGTFLRRWYVQNVLKTEESNVYKWDILFSASKGFTFWAKCQCVCRTPNTWHVTRRDRRAFVLARLPAIPTPREGFSKSCLIMYILTISCSSYSVCVSNCCCCRRDAAEIVAAFFSSWPGICLICLRKSSV